MNLSKTKKRHKLFSASEKQMESSTFIDNSYVFGDSRPYFCIYGINGLGVFTDKTQANRAAKYVISSTFSTFSDHDEAVSWAVNGYNELQKTIPDGISWPLDEELSLDWFYRSKKIKEMFPFR